VIAVVDDWGVRKVFVPADPASGRIEPMAEDKGRRKSITNSAYLLSKERDAAGVAVGRHFGSVLAFGVLPNGAA
jgi:hypothetical protein